MKERIHIPRCFRCQELGHTKYECKGPDRGNECLNCGEVGHMAKDCKNNKKEYCLNCKLEGHKNNSTKCPGFKKLLSEARARASRKRKKL